MSNILAELKKRNQSIGQMQVAIAILQIYNCRAAEVLSASWKDFYPDRFLILKGCKGSANIVIRDALILQTISSLPKLDPDKIFNHINYNSLFRYCAQRYAHLFTKFRTKKNRKITHGFRYMAVEFINDDAYVRDVLFHRSKKSGRYYKTKKESNNDARKKNKNTN